MDNLSKAIKFPDLQAEFEGTTSYVSWINSDIYPDGRIYTKEYTEWLERKVAEMINGLDGRGWKECGVCWGGGKVELNKIDGDVDCGYCSGTGRVEAPDRQVKSAEETLVQYLERRFVTADGVIEWNEQVKGLIEKWK